MAGTITHYKIGKLLLSKTDIKLDKKIFILACQGHDLLYFIKLTELSQYNKKAKLAGILQDTKFDSLVEAYEQKIIDHDLDIKLKSFLYGYITHHLTDSIFHPFINYFSKKYNHALIESIIDVKIVDDINEVLKDLTPLKDIDKLKKETEEVFSEIYQKSGIGRELVTNMNRVRNFIWLYRLDKTGIKKLGYKIIDKITHKYYEFLSFHYKKTDLAWSLDEKIKWRDPVTGDENYSSINDLIEQSLTKITSILNKIDKSLKDKKIADINLDISATDGKHLNMCNEQKYFKN